MWLRRLCCNEEAEKSAIRNPKSEIRNRRSPFRTANAVSLSLLLRGSAFCSGHVDQFLDQHTTRATPGAGATDVRHFFHVRHRMSLDGSLDRLFGDAKACADQRLLTLKLLDPELAIFGHRSPEG